MPRDLILALARRTARLHAVTAAAAAVLVGALVTVIVSLAGASAPAAAASALAAGSAAGIWGWRHTAGGRGPRAAAAALERVRPSGNLLVTAEELGRNPAAAPEWIRARVSADAARALTGLRASDVVASRGAIGLAGAAALATILAAAVVLRDRLPAGAVRSVREWAARVSDPDALRVRVYVDPPAYTGRPRTILDAPERIEVLEGSRIGVELSGADWRVRYNGAPVAFPFVARESGYFVVEREGAPERTLLIPLVVASDLAPVVRVETPGKDLLLPDGGREIPVRVTASDDLALQSLEVRYTRVSGAAEQFEFQEGTAAVSVQRLSAREWRGTAVLALPAMRLGAGDSLVYRAVARDRRAGEAGAASSDTFYVEIAGPGQIALEGVEMPPDMARYALSQQMIVLKLERLRARQASHPGNGIAEEAAALAAEQRAVRANFVFLLGGHVEDEEEEAEQSHEIQEGRLENTARRDVNAAIGHMTRAEQGMVAVDPGAALPPARLAVDALQRAFGRSRYLLRSLAVRSRLDPARRLSGDLRGAQDWARTHAERTPRDGEPVRLLFGRVLAAAARIEAGGAPSPDAMRALAEEALRVDPSSAVWQETARRILALAGSGVDRSEVRRQTEELLAKVSVEALRGTLPRMPAAAPESRLHAAWREAHSR